MTLQAIFWDLQFDCFDVRLSLKFFLVFLIAHFLFMMTFLKLFCVFSLCFCLVVKFTLLSDIYPLQTFDPSRSNGSKVQKFGAPFEGGFHFGTPILSNFISPLYWPTLKISCVWLEWLKSLNFGGPSSRKPPFWYPQTLVKFYFSFIFAYLKHLMFAKQRQPDRT